MSKRNTHYQVIADDASTFTEKMESVSAAEFGKRIASVMLQTRSSHSIFLIQQAFLDCEDDNGIMWEPLEKMLTRFQEAKDGN